MQIDATLLELCEKVSAASYNAIKNLVGTPEADTTLYIGADGTPTKLIDEVSESAIFQELQNDGRSMRVISEEFGEKQIGCNPEMTIIMDPLDGTHNALTGIPFYSISIAIANPCHAGINFGYVKDLVTGDVYCAEFGKGAYLNGQRVHTSKNSNLMESCISVYGYRQSVTKTANISQAIRRIRILGCISLELCYVASGKLDAFIDIRGSLRLTDVAAGKLIIEEAGGTVTDEKGCKLLLKEIFINKVYMIATNGTSHQRILEIIGR
ncbi:bifunctional fructose-bisphosphatase/inositol-phosphate phosphatase [uncultured Methanomethylovorans sp.]|uniref:bifunctional fructose-bisphosphatase/inositol-phosphate phosphatase n=1 Tax=uncultured Methanomethylovorans sp. TaxID=183759 RepID=UPI002AA725E4|nr:bifunctional fructose-bisphosphatase/inositol-phosphate phosphatase [uncultured Methanomethylovorans sp.]